MGFGLCSNCVNNVHEMCTQEVCMCSYDRCRGSYKPPQFDPVNRPKHYADTKIEVIDYIEDKNLGFHLGNCVKYISRAGKKDPGKQLEDLEKAQWYLNRYINKLKNNLPTSTP